jgi:hypothetical protein
MSFEKLIDNLDFEVYKDLLEVLQENCSQVSARKDLEGRKSIQVTMSTYYSSSQSVSG